MEINFFIGVLFLYIKEIDYIFITLTYKIFLIMNTKVIL